MKTILKSIALCIFIFAFVTSSMAQGKSSVKHSGDGHIILNDNKLEWKDGPASLPKGAQFSVIEGDLSKEGPFTIRLKLPANYKIAPHWHPAIEHVTILKGAFYMGMGEKFDMNAATKLSQGGFAVMPIKSVHFAFTKGESIIQLHGIGPWGINYVNETDDPRKAAE